MKYEDIVDKVSKELSLPKELVDKAYKSYWLFIRENIQSLPLKDNLSEEEFSRLRTNFNIPSLGKLNCSYARVLGVKKRYEYIKKIKESKEDAQDKED